MDQAIALFREGDLQQALELLEPLKGTARSSISQLSATLREIWNRNQLEQRRLVQLVEQERWWEALDSLNKLDHPWWQQQASAPVKRWRVPFRPWTRPSNTNSTQRCMPT